MSHIFREYDIRGRVNQDLTVELVTNLGKALATFYQKRQVTTISLGYDCRLSSPPFKVALAKSLIESGINIYNLGLVPTPLVYYSLFKLPVGGGVMITGSHNPSDENGFKICLGQSTIHGQEIQELRQYIESKTFPTGQGKLIERPILNDYLAEIKDQIHPGPRKLKLVIDAGNGTGNIAALELYQSLGWEVIDLYSEPDGNFPNHHPDPTQPENLADLIKKVIATGADLGIAFDGDADRIGVVDAKGRILWGDQLLIILAKEVLETNPGAKIIGEVKCSQTLFDSIKAMNGVAIMSKVGHSLIKAKMKTENALLAGEMSGHIFFADRYYGYDDAIYVGARLLEILSYSNDSFEKIVDQLPVTCSTPEIRRDCPDDHKFQVITDLSKVFAPKYPIIDLDGLRIQFKKGWGLIRASNTQPILVLRFEAETETALKNIRAEIEAELNKLIS